MKRLETIDLARGFGVLKLTAVHSILIFGSGSTQTSSMAALFYSIAEGPGAHLFMMVMGVSLVFSNKNWKEIFKRALFILLIGYVLNVLKFVIPMLAGWLPEGLLNELEIKNNRYGLVLAFLTGDILQFAGITLMLLALLKRLPYYQYYALGAVLIVCFFSPWMYDLHSSNFIINYVLQLLGGKPPRIFFPRDKNNQARWRICLAVPTGSRGCAGLWLYRYPPAH